MDLVPASVRREVRRRAITNSRIHHCSLGCCALLLVVLSRCPRPLDVRSAAPRSRVLAALAFSRAAPLQIPFAGHCRRSSSGASKRQLFDGSKRRCRGASCRTAVVASTSVADVKTQILQIAALTDRGQRLNKFISPTYQDKREAMAQLLLHLAQQPSNISEATLAGEWELIYSDVELFRSSPFFLAIEEALNSAPGIPLLGQWLGCTDPKKKAETFFKLHQLQVLSWGLSTVGRIAQRLDFASGTLESAFDTTIFGLTVIPILGWFKLLPTFGGRVITEADSLTLDAKGNLRMELQRTTVKTCPGVERIPLVDSIFMDQWYPVNAVWKLLPWNGGPFEGRAPLCYMSTLYVDDTMRVSRDGSGGLFVYTRPL